MEIEVHALVPDPVLPDERASIHARPRAARLRRPGTVPSFHGRRIGGAAHPVAVLVRVLSPGAVPFGARAFAPPFRSHAHTPRTCSMSRIGRRAASQETRSQPHLSPMSIRPDNSMCTTPFTRDSASSIAQTRRGCSSCTCRTCFGRQTASTACSCRRSTVPDRCRSSSVSSRRTGMPIRSTWWHICRRTRRCTWQRGTWWLRSFSCTGRRDARKSPVVGPGTAASQALQRDLLRWYVGHTQDRSVYKKLARSRSRTARCTR